MVHSYSVQEFIKHIKSSGKHPIIPKEVRINGVDNTMPEIHTNSLVSTKFCDSNETNCSECEPTTIKEIPTGRVVATMREAPVRVQVLPHFLPKNCRELYDTKPIHHITTTPKTQTTLDVSTEGDVFVNNSLTFIDDEPVIKIPIHILNVCRYLSNHVDGKEFSIACKGKWSKDGFALESVYEIPSQKIAYASVDYDLDDLTTLKQGGFNTIIHSHPGSHGSRSSFSSEDESSINKNFLCSVLYCGGNFCDSNLTIDLSPTVKLKIKGKIETEEEIPAISIPEEKLNKISLKSYETDWKRYSSNEDDWFPERKNRKYRKRYEGKWYGNVDEEDLNEDFKRQVEDAKLRYRQDMMIF